MTGWQARIVDDLATFNVRLLLSRPGGNGRFEIIGGALTATTLEAGCAAPADGGLVLPGEAVVAIADAVKVWRGAGSSESEAAVLRQWLDSERGRVDDILREVRLAALRGQG